MTMRRRLFWLLPILALALHATGGEAGADDGTCDGNGDVSAVEVVNLACALRGRQLEVIGADRTANGREAYAGPSSSCSEELGAMLKAGYRLTATAGNARSGIVHTLVAPPPLADDEFGLTTNGAAGCNCDDAIPVTNFNCISCDVDDRGACVCLFKAREPAG